MKVRTPKYRTLGLALRLWVLVSSVAVRSMADCPQSSIRVSPGSSAVYDFVTGSLAASVSPVVSFATVRAVDEFEITGLATSTPVRFKIRLGLDGYLAPLSSGHLGGGHLMAQVGCSQSSLSDSVSASYGAGPSAIVVSEDLDLDVEIDGTTSFRAVFVLDLGSDIAAEPSSIRGNIRFVELPTGAGVRSCSGFVQEPVAVRRSTWARVKTLFR